MVNVKENKQHTMFINIQDIRWGINYVVIVVLHILLMSQDVFVVTKNYEEIHDDNKKILL